MRGKAYRRLLSARRRPLLVLLLVVVVLVVWRVTVVVAPRWVGLEVLAVLVVLVAACLAVIFLRGHRPPAAAPPAPVVINLLDELRAAEAKYDWVDDPEFLRRLANAQARQAGRGFSR